MSSGIEGKVDRRSKKGYWISLLPTIIPVILALSASIVLLIEWRAIISQEIAQLREDDKNNMAVLMRQIKSSSSHDAQAIKDLSDHVSMNRQQMEINRQDLKQFTNQLSRLQGSLYASGITGPNNSQITPVVPVFNIDERIFGQPRK